MAGRWSCGLPNTKHLGLTALRWCRMIGSFYVPRSLNCVSASRVCLRHAGGSTAGFLLQFPTAFTAIFEPTLYETAWRLCRNAYRNGTAEGQLPVRCASPHVRTRGSVVGIATGLRGGRSGVRIPRGTRYFSFLKASRPALAPPPPRLPTQWASWIKREVKAFVSIPCRGENEWGCTSNPHVPLWRGQVELPLYLYLSM